MRVDNVRINGIRNPIGYAFDTIRLSFRISGAEKEMSSSGGMDRAKIIVSRDAAFSMVVYEKEETEPNSACILLDFVPTPRTRYFVKVWVAMKKGDSCESVSNYFFETGKMNEEWKAKWITHRDEDTFHPVFIKNFETDKAKRILTARLYISGLGMYEAYINGDRVGEELLTPYYSDYHREVQYQTYDVTRLIGEQNRIEVLMGNGWYKGTFGLAGSNENWGSKFMLLSELHVVYEDGTEDICVTDDSWTYKGSEIEDSDIYHGYIYNGLLWKDSENYEKEALISNYKGNVISRISPPVLEQEIIALKEIITTPNKETVLDFGQNFAGYVSFYSELPKGAKVVLECAEILQDGNFYHDNYRAAKSKFTYISDGKSGWVSPKFTWFGFRYIKITGWVGEITKENFVGKAIYTSMERTGFVQTGHDKVNRLISNVLWGQKSNSIDFPTDCPQRDERLGWCGDAQVFARTASYNMRTGAFYDKFMHDLMEAQEQLSGIMPGVIPVFDKNSAIYSSVWGDIATILPTVLYEYFGDIYVLKKHYPAMKAWVDRITEDDAKRGQKYLFDWGAQLGDWLALDGRTEQSMSGGTDEYFIGSCYYAMSVELLAKAAKELGYASDEVYYLNLHDHIREAILKEYFTDSGRLSIDTQTGYVVSLYTGIYKEKQRVIDGLKKRLYKDCYKLKCGFVGAPILCRVLADNDMVEEAYYFLLQTGYPGWLHCIDLGATTIWERWNSVLDDGHLSGTMMNSLNHYAFGSVEEFLYRNVAGIKPIKPGFKKAAIEPAPNIGLRYMDCTYRSVYGDYRVFWEIKQDGMLHLKIEIPFDCSAAVKLPFAPKQVEGYESETFTAGVYEFEYQPERDLLCRYSEGTLFKDMMTDKEAMEIIHEDSPLLEYFLSQEDYRYESLSTLSNMFYMGFSDEMIGKLKKDLMKLRTIGGNENVKSDNKA
ncbi:alpha-L-rhamnosidase [Butyrivibrio sp. WCE2006]|uniref:alpha-L-rhamnosidase n=1 Tax=Butyrivibrio sp. WCE2006 TaxID=1410611 RepID=UPI0005D2CED2|nr:alpha-L-rhamnosidase [Butyrivibrio sp. WCE2006]